MHILKQCLSSDLCAQWFTAFGTILLAIVTVWITYFGDSATRLMKKKIIFDFQKKCFYFLSSVFNTPEKAGVTSENFYKEIIDNRIYLNWFNRRKLVKYLRLSNQLGKEWQHGNDVTQGPLLSNILREIEKLKKIIE
jgi:hypothetical protein